MPDKEETIPVDSDLVLEAEPSLVDFSHALIKAFSINSVILNATTMSTSMKVFTREPE